MSKIFVQIASYRDPQLLFTLEDLQNNCSKDSQLKICVHNQYSDEDVFNKELEKFRKKKNFIFIDTPYQEAKGACWARNAIQQYYNGEDYTLQLDSHHRFVKDWDLLCINMIKDLQKDGYKKPLLTGYIPSFDPENDPQARIQEPWRMSFDRFTPEGVVFFLPERIPNWENLDKPVTSRFYSAHFCFTLGQFSEEVQHDPDYYFHGEEISIAARAFTHGYDLFHPHKVIAWHEYTRKGRTKHWDDDKEWHIKNINCHKRNRNLFSMEGERYNPRLFGKYGFGKERDISEYEEYAGISFIKRGIQQYTLDKEYPPNPFVEDFTSSILQVFKHCIDVNYTQVPENDYEYWVVAFHDKGGNTIFREDIYPEEIQRIKNDSDGYCKIWKTFNTDIKPAYWVVWPFSKSKGWCEKLTGDL